MDQEKLKQWMNLSKNMYGGDFWKGIFDDDTMKHFMQDLPFMDSASASKPDSKKGFPEIDIVESQKELVLIIYLPGVEKNHVQLASYGEYIVIKGSKPFPFPEQAYRNIESHYGEFERKLKLPDYIVPSEASAKFLNGILYVSYSKAVVRGDIIPIE